MRNWYSSICTSRAVVRKTAVIAVWRTGHPEMYHWKVLPPPAEPPECNATMPGVTQSRQLLPPPQYLMLPGGSWGSVIPPVHQRYHCNHCCLAFKALLSIWISSRLQNQMSLLPQSLLSKSALPYSSSKPCRSQRVLCRPAFSAQAPSVNVNPFTPDTVQRKSEHYKRKNCRSDGDDDDGHR